MIGLEQISVSGTSFLEHVLCTGVLHSTFAALRHNSRFLYVLIFPSFWAKSLRSQPLMLPCGTRSASHDAAGVDSHGVGRADAGAYHKNWQQRSSICMEYRCCHTIEWASMLEGRRIFLTKKLAATCFLGSSWFPPTRKKIGSNVLPWNFVASLLLKKIGSNILPWNFVASLLLNNF